MLYWQDSVVVAEKGHCDDHDEDDDDKPAGHHMELVELEPEDAAAVFDKGPDAQGAGRGPGGGGGVLPKTNRQIHNKYTNIQIHKYDWPVYLGSMAAWRSHTLILPSKAPLTIRLLSNLGPRGRVSG